MVTVAVGNNKGGTGKTKTTEHLARAMAALGYSVTIIDLDGQANLTDSMLGTAPGRRPEVGIAEVLTQKAEIRQAICPIVAYQGFGIVPSDGRLDDVADDLVTSPLGVLRLKTALEQMQDRLDIVLIDCPPNVGVLTFAALIAADYVIVPAVPQAWAINGVQRISEKIAEVKQALGRGPVMLGTIATMTRATAEHTEGLRQLTGDDRPTLLGTVPMRGGLTSDLELAQHYAPIAEAVLEQIGGAR